MKQEAYTEIEVTGDFAIFDFVSSGKHGDILKRVIFEETEKKGLYNLAMGDVEEDNEINDFAVTDNGDRNKVIATVAIIIGAFARRYPDRLIVFRGGTDSRTRLYRMAIGMHFNELIRVYEIMGIAGGKLVAFEKEGEYEGFLIRRKIVNLRYEKGCEV